MGKRALRISAIAAAAVLSILALLLAAGWGALQTGAGKRALAGLIEDAASGPDATLAIEGLDGALPGTIRIARIALSDGEGIWLEAESVALDWRPLALLAGTARVDAVSAGRIAVLRAPAGGDTPADEADAPFSLPRLPVAVRVDRLAFPEIALGAPLLGLPPDGEGARLRAEGRLSAAEDGRVETRLEIDRLDGPAAHLALDAVFETGARTLDLDLRLADAADGLVARLAGIDDLPALSLTLAGKGSIADWRGRLEGSAGERAHITADLTLAARDEDGGSLAFSAEGSAAVAPFLPAEARPFAEPALDIALAGRWAAADDTLHIDEARLAGGRAEATASGRLDLDGETLAATLALRAGGGPALAGLLDPVRLDGLSADIAAEGKLAAPRLTIGAELSGIDAGAARAEGLQLDATLAPSGGDGDDGAVDWRVEARAQARGFAATDPGFAPLAGAAPSLSLAARYEAGANRIAVERARLEADTLALEAHGTLAPDGSAAALELSGEAADLSRLAALSGLDLSGRASLAGSLRGSLDRPAGTLRLDAPAFASGIAILDALTGGRLALTAGFERAPDTGLALRDIVAETANARLSASATLSPDFERISADYALDIADLAPLSDPIGVPLAGAARATGRAEGVPGSPAIDARITAGRLSVAGEALREVVIDLQLADPTDTLDGDVALTAVHAAGPLSASTGLALGETTLALAGLRVEAPGLRLDGTDIALPLDGTPATGRIDIEAADLAPLSRAAGQPVAGRATAGIDLVARDGTQGADIALSARELRVGEAGDGPAIGTLSAELRVDDPAGELSLSGEANAARVAAGPARLETLSLSLSGSPAALDYGIAAKGEAAGKPLDLAARGRIAMTEGEARYGIASLGGTLAGRELALESPLDLRMAGPETTLDPVALRLGAARIDAEGRLAPDAVAATLTVDDMPADIAGEFWSSSVLDGALDARLTLSGDPANPRGGFTLASRGLSVRATPQTPPQPFDARAEASLADGRLEASLSLSGAGDPTVSARASLPLRLSLADGAFEMPGGAPVSGSLVAQGSAGSLDELFSLDPHRLTGGLDVDVALAGTLDAPELSGSAGLAGGTYENLEMGTLLDDLDLRLDFTRTAATLAGSASDTESGRVELDGRAALGRGASLDARLRMRQATLVRRDDVTATASGEIAATGPLDALAIAGTIRTDRVEVRLVDDLPASVVTLDVVEINRGGTDETAKAGADEEDVEAPFAATLDIRVEIPRRLFVRGRGLDSEWEGAMAVTGTFAQTKVAGELRAVRGQFAFAGKTFVLQSGTIAVADRGGEVAATLDLAARYAQDGFTAVARITGPATDPQIAFSSTPDLPRDEILSRILFGRGTGKLSALEAVQLAEAAATLSGHGGSAGILDRVRETLGVDVLRVGSGRDGNSPSVTAGQYIADGVFVGARQGAGPGTTGATVEVEITPRISLEGDATHSGGSGVGVKWHYDY